MHNNSLYNKYDFFVFSLIVSLVFGKFGGALMIPRVLAILYLPAMLSKYRFSKVLLKKYLLFFCLFLLFCTMSLVWTPDREQGIKELVYYPVHFILFFEIIIFSRYVKNPVHTISWSWLIAVSATLVVAIWEIKTGNHLQLSRFEAEDILLTLNGNKIERPFASVTFGNFNGYVTYLCFAMPFILFYLINNIKNIKRVVLTLIVVGASVFTLLINASRGGLLSVIVMGAVLFLTSKKSIYKTLIVVIAGVGILYYVIPNWDTLFMAMSIKSEGDVLYTDDSRFDIWYHGLIALSSYMYIGTGIGGLAAAMRQVYSGVSITHNMLLEVLVQYGFLFFIPVVVFLIRLFLSSRKINERNIKLFIYMSLLAFPIYSIIDSGYLLNPLTYIAIACIVVFVSVGYNKSTFLFNERCLER